MIQLRPTRMTVTDQRPTLSYRVAVNAPSIGRQFWLELVLATDPGLFLPKATPDRSEANFITFSGRFPVHGGDAIVEIPPGKLIKLKSADRIYAAAALFDARRDGNRLALFRPDAEGVYVSASHFTGAGLYRRFGFANRTSSQTEEAPLHWAGDQPDPETPSSATPLSRPANLPSAGLPRKGPDPMNQQPSGFMHQSHNQAQAPAPATSQPAQPAMDYDDGFGAPPPAAPPPAAVMPGQAAPQPMPVMPGDAAPAPMPVMPGQAAPAPMPVMPGQAATAPQPVMPGQAAPLPQPVTPGQAAPAPAAPAMPPQTAPAQQAAYARPFDYVLPEFDSLNPLDIINKLREAWSRYESFTAGVNDTRAFPFSAIALLEMEARAKSGNHTASFTGTGFYIAPNLILTNAHNYAESRRYNMAHTGKVYAAMNSSDGTLNARDAISVETITPASDVTLHPLYDGSDSDTSMGHDLAIVRVANAAPNGQYFQIANFSPSQDLQIAVCGYGASSSAQRDNDFDWQDLLPTAQADYRQRMDADIIREIAHGGECILYNLQTLSGNSGSPVFIQGDGSDTGAMPVVGVHSSRVPGNQFRNRGVWLTPAKRDWALSGGTTPVASSQGYYPSHPHRPQYGHAMTGGAGAAAAVAGVEILAAAGIAAFQSSSGDITWNLSNMAGWLPAGGHPTPDIPVPRDQLRQTNLEVASPVYDGGVRTMYAHFNMRFLHDGTGVGGIVIEPAPHVLNDAMGGALRIDMHIEPLLETANSTRQTGVNVAVVKVTMIYNFNWTFTEDTVIVDYRLYGDGTYESSVRGGRAKLDDTDTSYAPHRR